MPPRCAACGVGYHVKPSKASKSRYCSRDCMADGYRSRMVGAENPNYRNASKRTCETCRVEFQSYSKTRRFCSMSCGAKSPANVARLTAMARLPRKHVVQFGPVQRRPRGPRPKNGRASPAYSSWSAMLSRTRSPSREVGYAYGVQVAERWRSFDSFLADMGERPSNTTLDRIDRTRPYEPGNVRWASKAVQSRNRKCTKLEDQEPDQIRWLVSLGYRGREIARFFDVSEATVSHIKSGDNWR
jgi:hypothetical protein